MSKRCTVIIAFLLIVIAGGIYKLIFQGDVSESTDSRASILLDAEEMDIVLAEMRMFLESTQQIIKGANENDMKLVAEVARKVGKTAQGTIPATLREKLPIEFKQLGSETHVKFDQLAMDAEDLEDSSLVLEQLSVLMQNCISCHAAFRLEYSGK